MSERGFYDQIVFGTDNFAENPEPRCPCVLLLDTSGSMQGAPIAELNAGLAAFKDELSLDAMAAKRVEVALVTFGPVKLESPFQTSFEFNPPKLCAHGDTPIGEAIIRGLELVSERKNEYRASGISFFRPWVFLITDGAPTDSWQSATRRIHEGDCTQVKAFSFFAVGVAGADMTVLKKLSVREPLMLQGLRFRELFRWISNSMKSVSRSVPGGDVSLTPPGGWAKL
jgi:uncharacterized protein YegL